MELFLNYIETLFFLGIVVLIGVVIGRVFKLSIKNISIFNEFGLTPLFIFGSIILVEINLSLLWIVIFAFLLMSVVSILSWKLTEKFTAEKTGNLIGLCAGMGNSGNYGIPIVKVLFGSNIVPLYSLFIVAQIIYTATVGYYIASREQRPMIDAVKFVLKLPLVYAGLLALIIQLGYPDTSTQIETFILQYWDWFLNIVIGMGLLIMGLGFASMKIHDFKIKFQTLVFLTRFGLFPLLTVLFIIIDQQFLHLLTTEIYHLFIIFSILPCAITITILAAMTNIEPGRAAAAILTTTIFATFFIPIVAYLWF